MDGITQDFNRNARPKSPLGTNASSDTKPGQDCRGVVLANYRGDPVAAAAAHAAPVSQAERHAVAILAGCPVPAAKDGLQALHEAIKDCCPVGFDDTGLSEQKARRGSAAGVCQSAERGGQAADLVPGSRQSPEVLRAGDALDETPQDGDFATGRRALLQGLVKEKGSRARG